MNSKQIFETFQSGFRAFHSTETALVRVLNDLLLAGDAVFYSVLILLDLSSAFDIIDHDVLINHLKSYIGISDRALDWFISYLANRSFSVEIGETSSSRAPLFCGVPQGLFWAPCCSLFTCFCWDKSSVNIIFFSIAMQMTRNSVSR
ncbi:hypothetical protein LDENG_00112390 [Lucifuga dentata]|nr:hypothetical protein LDENG_00112390 [Lucifuga dentata]